MAFDWRICFWHGVGHHKRYRCVFCVLGIPPWKESDG
jgi:hypothetical protein